MRLANRIVFAFFASMIGLLAYAPHPHSEEADAGLCAYPYHSGNGQSSTTAPSETDWFIDVVSQCERVAIGSVDPATFKEWKSKLGDLKQTDVYRYKLTITNDGLPRDVLIAGWEFLTSPFVTTNGAFAFALPKCGVVELSFIAPGKPGSAHFEVFVADAVQTKYRHGWAVDSGSYATLLLPSTAPWIYKAEQPHISTLAKTDAKTFSCK